MTTPEFLAAVAAEVYAHGDDATVALVDVLLGHAERCTACGHIQAGQSGQCRSCGACGTVTGEDDIEAARKLVVAARAVRTVSTGPGARAPRTRVTTPEKFRAAAAASPATAAHLARIDREIPAVREHFERTINTFAALGADRVRVCRGGWWHPDAIKQVLAEYAAAGWTVVTGIDAGGDLAILTTGGVS